MAKKSFLVFLSFLMVFIQPYAYAGALKLPEELNYHQIKNASKQAKSIKADVIFKSAVNDSNYYAVKGKVIPFSKLAPVARKRLFCATPGSAVACAFVTNIAYEYFSDELNLRDYNYNVDTNTYKRPMPANYKVQFCMYEECFSTAQEAINSYDSQYYENIRNRKMSERTKANLERDLSSIDQSVYEHVYKYGSKQIGIYGFTYDYGQNSESYNNISVRLVDLNFVDGARKQETLTSQQFDKVIEESIANAPEEVLYDLMQTSDYLGESHDVLTDAVSEVSPYNYATGEYYTPQNVPNTYPSNVFDYVPAPNPDPDPDTDSDPDPDPGPDPDPNPDPDPDPGPNDNIFALPSFCEWATPVCNLADFVTGEPDDWGDDDEYDLEGELPDKDPESFDISYVQFGSECPSFEPVNISIGTVSTSVTFDLTPLCQFANTVSPAILAMAYLVGLRNVANAIKET